MMDYIDSYHTRTRLPEAQRPRLHDVLKADVCIVGGGLAGLATAVGLAERGVTDVVLLESQRVGWGASGRNGDFVSPHYTSDTEGLIRRVGLEHTRELIKFSRRATDLVRSRDAWKTSRDRKKAGRAA